MKLEHSNRPSAIELANLVPAGGLVVAVTDRKASAWKSVHSAAIDVARAARSGVVLFDRAAASSWSDPYPSGPFTADVDGPRGDRPLRPSELDALGRHDLLEQVRQIEAEGVPAFAWLPRWIGPSGVQRAVEGSGAHLVLMAEEPARSSSLAVLRRTLEHYAARLSAPLAAIDESGNARLVGGPRTLPRPVPSGGRRFSAQTH